MSAGESATALFAILDETRRRLRRAALAEGVTVALFGAALALVAGVTAAALGMRGLRLALLELAILIGVLVFAVLRYAGAVSRSLRGSEPVAAWLDRALGGNAEDVAFTSAVELARDRGRFGESSDLADAAVLSAARRAGTVEPRVVVRKVAWPSLRRRLITFAIFAAAAIALAFLAPAQFSAALGALSEVRSIDSPLSTLPPEPRLGDIRVSYHYPAYAKRPPRIASSSTGEIEALPGTEVVIETRVKEAPLDATVITTTGDAEGDESRIACEIDGRQLRATMIVSRAGSYRFRLRERGGGILEERRGHKITLELDAPPDVSLYRPEKSPLEVTEKDVITVEFAAKDDFALGDAAFAWRVLGSTREGKEPLSSAARGLPTYRGTAQLELARLNLKPGDRVAYSVEVKDNDTVNGPKAGASETRELRVYSKEAHHRDVLALQEKALDELVHLLGDNLESAFKYLAEPDPYDGLLGRAEKIVQRAVEANVLLLQTVEAARRDPLGRKGVAQAFESARQDLAKNNGRKQRAVQGARKAFARARQPDEGQSRLVGRAQEAMVTGLEKSVLYLSDLLNDARMLEAQAIAKKLREEQENLRRALEEYKTAPDAEKRAKLEQAIRDIRQRINELLGEMAQIKSKIPQDYVNPDAFQEQDELAGMDRVQQMLEEGDLDGAMRELEKMLKTTEEMISKTDEGRDELTSREYGEFQELAQKLMKDLEKVERDQRELARRTETRSRSMLDRMKDRLGDRQAFVEKQKRRLEQAKQALLHAEPFVGFNDQELFEGVMRRIEDTERALQTGDFGAARDMAERSMQNFNQLQAGSPEQASREMAPARPNLEEVLRDIQRLMPPPNELLSKDELAQLGQMAGEQGQLGEATRRLGETLEKLQEMIPMPGGGMQGMIGEAQEAMGGAQEQLGQGDAPGGLNDQRRALESLGKLRDALEQMGQSGGKGGGVPLPWTPQGQEGGEEDSRNNNGDPSMNKVEIPKPEQYKAPAEFREDILEAAKHGTVEAYREAVRRYYEELVK